MNKRFWISVAVMFVMFVAIGFFVHGFGFVRMSCYERSSDGYIGYFFSNFFY